MDVLLTAAPSLARWEGRPFSPGVLEGVFAGDARDVYTRVVAHERPGGPARNGPFSRVAEAILAYRVFEPTYVTGVLRRVPLQNGDTVGIHFLGFPLVTLFFAARVIARYEDSRRVGFTYRTLEGHPELGEETFEVEKDHASGAVKVTLQAWSRPGLWYTRAAFPITRVLQKKAGRGALDHLGRIAAGSSA